MSMPPADWLLWPEAMTWLLSRDRLVTSEIGEWFRDRMAANRSASIVYAIRLSEIALEHAHLSAGEENRSMAAATAVDEAERELVRMLERGDCVARGRPSNTASPELIPAWDWADSIIVASRSFELRGVRDREVKFYDVRLDSSRLPGWNCAAPSFGCDDVNEQNSATPWSEEQMIAAVAACTIPNRDKAWAQVFRPQREEHQWDVRAFRTIWSNARGTRGQKGRPTKARG
jgi:hypothetical protein